jgi:transcriptional regulator with XRE-family HTH domain
MRDAVGVTQEQLGALMDRSKQWVFTVETGKSAGLRLDDLEKLEQYGFNAAGYVIGNKPNPLTVPYDVARERIRVALSEKAAVS